MTKYNYMTSIGLIVYLCLSFIACQSDDANNYGFESEAIADTKDNGTQFIAPVSEHGQLAVKNGTLVDQQGNPVLLRGISYGWHNWWPRFFNKESVHSLAYDWQANVVRAPMGIDPDGAYLDDKALGVQCITDVVDGAIEAGIYVIIDWHCHTIKTEEAKAFFTEMATKYAGKPNVIYEIFNEPEEQSWEDVKAYSIEIIKAIRAIDSKNIILVGSPHWDTDLDLVVKDPITGYDNLMYTLHFYAASHKESVRNKGQIALDAGLPLFVSECAYMEYTGEGTTDIDSWNTWVSWMESNNISYATWAFTDGKMLTHSASSGGPWPDAQITDWGKIAKQETLKNSLMK